MKPNKPSFSYERLAVLSNASEPGYDDFDQEGGGGLAVEVAKPKLKRPPLYRVILLNDDYTTMEFVVRVLTLIFHHDEERAAQIMMHVHQKGAGVCGVYTREIAETKVDQVMEFAKRNQHPLQCTMEPDSDDSE